MMNPIDQFLCLLPGNEYVRVDLEFEPVKISLAQHILYGFSFEQTKFDLFKLFHFSVLHPTISSLKKAKDILENDSGNTTGFSFSVSGQQGSLQISKSGLTSH
jgi:hypothetical protein